MASGSCPEMITDAKLADAGFDGCFMLELACPPTALGPYFQRAVDAARRWHVASGIDLRK